MSALILAILVSIAPAVTAQSVASADSTGSLRPAAPMPVPSEWTASNVELLRPVALAAPDNASDAAAVHSDILRGQATWYASATRGNAAAGPALRRFIGHGWRGAAVDVCRSGTTWITCVRVRLTDWCACSGERVIDLSDEDFATLAPLSAGVVRVRVALGAPPRETITQPPTDTAGD